MAANNAAHTSIIEDDSDKIPTENQFSHFLNIISGEV